jgi:membrane fusion protein (multidrug efflux system)
MRMPASLFFGLSLTAVVLAGCTEKEAAPAAAAPPPSKVGIVTARPEPLPVVSELPGRVAPTRIAEVRPRVGGIVLERIFQQGSDVVAGQPLFKIDPATFQVAVEAAEATVARADAVLLEARQASERTRSLVATRTSSQANLDSAVALQKQAEADLASAKASLKAAQLNLEYATINAPIAGRIGRALVTEGALVSAGESASLATIQQLDPIYADFRQPVSELIRLRNALKSGALEQIAPDVAKASLVMDDGSEYPLPGRLLFSEATVDPTSGQVTLRAEFPNPDGNLLPGMYVRVAIEQGIDAQAIALPTQAIQRDSTGLPQVYVVGADNKAELRSIRATRVLGNRTVVDEGLKAGERVIVDGFQKIGPGAAVEVADWVDPASKPAEAAPAETAKATPPEGAAAEGAPAAAPAAR